MRSLWVVSVAGLMAPVLIIALSVPMAMRRVPPNGFYGFRTAKTFSSERTWYDANQKAGINLLVAGCLALMVWGVLRLAVSAAAASVASVPVLLVLVLAAVVVSFAQLSKM